MELSVIMPVFNAEDFVLEAIESVLNQTYKDFEFIIINDGSSDNSLKIISELNDNRIVLIDQENRGLAKALNAGLAIAKGLFIARMDADDICIPTRFEHQLRYLKRNPGVMLLGTAVENIDVAGNFVSYDIPYIRHNFLKKYLFNIGNPFKHPTIMMNRRVALEAGGYNECIKKYFEDYFLWSKISKVGKIEILPVVLLKYRITPGSIMSSIKDARFSEFMLKMINKGFFTNDDLLEMRSIKENKSNIDQNRMLLYETRIKAYSSSKLNKLVVSFSRVFGLKVIVLIASIIKSRYISFKLMKDN